MMLIREEGLIMKKNVELKSLEILAKLAFSTAAKEANSACFLFGYQPKVPAALKEKKEKK